LVIESVGLTMPVVPVGVAADGAMALPRSPAQAGWYRFGASPGDAQGAVVIAGHLDEPWYGTGPLGRLAEVAPGDTVVVGAGSTAHRFVVTDVQAVRKTRLDLPALFRTDGPPSLHIVTCGGRFDPVQRRYDENVVVVARPA
jgi:sortase (surface protein transpeptidase)